MSSKATEIRGLVEFVADLYREGECVECGHMRSLANFGHECKCGGNFHTKPIEMRAAMLDALIAQARAVLRREPNVFTVTDKDDAQCVQCGRKLRTGEEASTTAWGVRCREHFRPW